MQCRDKWERRNRRENEEGAEKRRKENCSAGPHFSAIFENVWICSELVAIQLSLSQGRPEVGFLNFGKQTETENDQKSAEIQIRKQTISGQSF